MKKSITELIIIIILITVIYIKDMFLYKDSQIKLVETIINQDLNNKLDEYSNLLKEYNLAKTDEFKCIARIKNRKINEFYNYILIFNNKHCHLKKDDIVLNNDGFVGIVTNVYNNFAKVSLITNPNNNISIRINNNFGTLKSKKGKLYVYDLVNENNISLNDEVYTSGLTSIPKGILVGRVSKVTHNGIEIKSSNNILDNPYVSIYGE